jgi:hypothetical protein
LSFVALSQPFNLCIIWVAPVRTNASANLIERHHSQTILRFRHRGLDMQRHNRTTKNCGHIHSKQKQMARHLALYQMDAGSLQSISTSFVALSQSLDSGNIAQHKVINCPDLVSAFVGNCLCLPQDGAVSLLRDDNL